MKDFALSLLSRGCGQVVQTDKGSQDGRLEVCFEPEDYFNWKSQPPLLRLSSSGRLLGGVGPAPPKTYSTRRGPLILYSEDLALSSCQSEEANRKRRVDQHSRQDVDLQLRTLRDLTGAVLAYGKKQPKEGCNASDVHPLLPAPKCSSKGSLFPLRSTWHPQEDHCGLNQSADDEQSLYRSQGDPPCPTPAQARYQPHFFCSRRPHGVHPGALPPITEGLAHRWGEEASHPAQESQMTSEIRRLGDHKQSEDLKRASLRIVVETSRVPMSPIPEAESDAQEVSTRQPEDGTAEPAPECVIGCPGHICGHGKCSVTAAGVEDRPCPLSTACVDSSWGCSRLSHISYYGGHMSGAQRGSTMRLSGPDLRVRRADAAPDPSFSILHLPPIPLGHLVQSGKERKCTGKAESSGLQERWDLQPPPPLRGPDINPEACLHKPLERAVHRKLLLLVPEQLEKEDTQQPKGGLHGNQAEERERGVHCDERGQKREPIKRGGGPPSDRGCRFIGLDQDHLILLEPGEEQAPSLGALPPLVGRRGPGKQSSMAVFRHDLKDPSDSSESQTGAVRGSLPVELKEWQKGRAVGTLIMGPGGEIIRLSLWDPTSESEDLPLLDDATREQALHVLASEGVLEQPWTILLQAETTDTGEGNACEPEAPSVSRKQSHFIHERVLVEGVINDQMDLGETQGFRSDHDMERCGQEQSPVPQRPREVNDVIINQPHCTVEEAERVGAEETDELQSDAQGGPVSSRPKNVAPENSPPKPAHSTPKGDSTAGALFHKTNPQAPAGVLTDTGKSQTKKSGIAKDDTQRRRGKKKGEVDHHGEVKEKEERIRKETETDTPAAEDAPAAPTLEKRKTKGANEGSKGGAWKTPGAVAKKGKRKEKGQAEFVVGKPKKRQLVERTEDEAGRSERPETHNEEPRYTEQEPQSEDGCALLGDHVQADVELVVDRGSVSPRSHSSVGRASSRGQSSRRPSSSEEAPPCSPGPISLTQLSPRSAATTTESQSQVLNPVKSEASSNDKSSEDAVNRREHKAAALVEKAERRRLEVERKRREKEEERRRQQEREGREERMRLELEGEQRQRAEEARLRRLMEEEERQRREEEEAERERREQAEKERERRRQEEKRRQLEHLLRLRQEEEERRAVELERQRLEEEARREEERRRLQEMEEGERVEYLHKQREEREERRRAEEERRREQEEAALRAREEARLQAELFARQKAALEQQLRFQRGLMTEAGALGVTQDISRPWVYSYFTLLNLLGIAEHLPAKEDLEKEIINSP